MRDILKYNNSGTIYIILSFLIWGTLPIYFKSIQMVTPLEILAQRIVWSVIFLIVVTIIKKQLHEIIKIFYRPRILLTFVCTAALISSNWLVYIWAVLNNHIMEASFGSFIGPIFNIFLGLIFLKEKLNLAQLISLIITIIAVIFQFVEINFQGFTPFISILLAGSFGFYALLRKQIKADSILGLTIETILLSPIALIYLLYLDINNNLIFFNSIKISFLLIFSGIVTSVPLILYFTGAKLLPLSKVGFFQYISPTIQLFIAVHLFNENISLNKKISFYLVWSALILYILSNLFRSSQKTLSSIKK